MRDAIGDVSIRCHFHNTRNTGMANAYAAVEAGVGVLDASLGGIGGCPFAPRAVGNIPTEDLVYMLERAGVETGVSLERLIAAAEWLGEQLGRAVPGLLSRAGPSRPPARLDGDGVTMTRRSSAVGTRGMVACDNALATAAGIEMLAAGGTAADAVVAADAVLGVVQPMSTGLGGDATCIVALDGSIESYQGTGAAGAGLDHGPLVDAGVLDPRDPRLAVVPGVVDAWTHVLGRHGRLGLQQRAPTGHPPRR